MNEQSFDDKRIADGYAKDRPYLHPMALEWVKREFTKKGMMPEGGFDNGLDVGCGAGLSTKALKEICRHVTGTDISEEMIKAAKELCGDDGYSFAVCRAEKIESETPYDIVTAAGVVNWVRQGAFLRNLHRYMAKDSCLVIYDFWITDQMLGVSSYTDWWHNRYLPKFPKSYWEEDEWTGDEVRRYGFSMGEYLELGMTWDFDLDSFIRFMMIQSNVNEQIEKGMITEEAARQWFEESLRPIFGGKIGKLVFDGYIWYLKRQS